MTTETLQNRIRTCLVLLACGVTPIALSASCDPRHQTLDILRFDDDHDDFGVYVDDCYFFDCFYEEIIFFD